MNPNNYASLEASKRLVEAGIKLETDFFWSPIFDLNNNVTLPLTIKDWELVQADYIRGSIWAAKAIPAPSMVEVWRELPHYTQIVKLMKEDRFVHYAFVWPDSNDAPRVSNPADALIDLLIWVTEQRKEKGDASI
jgi:hypothetical protein